MQAAFNYARAFPEEIDQAIADNDAMDFTALSQRLPGAKELIVSGPVKKQAMLKLLLDEPISPEVATGRHRKQ